MACYHCGEPCTEQVSADDKNFCCTGCRQVYLLLSENNLCSYYDLDEAPGIKAKGKFTGKRFDYLDDPALIEKLVQFSSPNQTNVLFYLPQMHCSSCIYLLENLHRVEQAVIQSRVNFQRKEIFVSIDPSRLSLRKLVELLAFIGYEPTISLQEIGKQEEEPARKKQSSSHKKKIYEIGVAGFCFANIMMLSFPEYFAGNKTVGSSLENVFRWLNLALSLPVLLFSSVSILSSGWKGLRQRYINIDLPISLAIVVTYGRSYYEIITGTGAGYLDSGTGIVFFMLIGRWFQEKTFDSLSFERDYRSFLPLGVSVMQGKAEANIPVGNLQVGDRILVRNGEMIPADAVLLRGEANIDYSFVSGETLPLRKSKGELVHAGGKQVGDLIELEVAKKVSQSYITELWNNDVFNQQKNKQESFIHPWSRYFSAVLLAIAFCTAMFWLIKDPAVALPATTAVLIVACPCSLLLSATFTYGNMLRIFAKNKLYLKNANVIESLAAADTIVFDKTGTITVPETSDISYAGTPLNDFEKHLVGQVSKQSTHPLSKIVSRHLQPDGNCAAVSDFQEHEGRGVAAMIEGVPVSIGSADFVGSKSFAAANAQVHVKIGEEVKGFFSVGNHYREGIEESVSGLSADAYEMHLLSGDNSSEERNLQSFFGKGSTLKFYRSPQQKLDYIKLLQSQRKNVLMIGDGINDAGALRQANAGISVSNNDTRFTPGSDGILQGTHVRHIHQLLRYAKSGKKIVRASFILSILYNIAGLSFAVSGQLGPVVAAILMPASSISIVVFVTLLTNSSARRIGLS